jgi:hypothetical protein
MSDLFKLIFEDQAKLRREKAAEHSDDKRDIESAEIFDVLAATAVDVPLDVKTAAEERFSDPAGFLVFNAMLREVGFQSHPANAEEFVREFIAESAGAHPKMWSLGADGSGNRVGAPGGEDILSEAGAERMPDAKWP